MTNDKLITKLSHNKLLLYLVPNFVYFIILLHYYNVNFLGVLEVTFTEIIFIGSIFFLLTNIFYLILLKILKDRQKVFIITTFISFFYNVNLDWKFLLILLLFTIILIIEFKFLFKFKLDKPIFIIIFMISIVFLYNLSFAMINLASMTFNNKEYDEKITINHEKDTPSPNIYYIHCDGMMSFDGIEKYFNYNNTYLKDYLKDYYINEDALLVAGHRTQRALVSLFNPNYHDKFFKDYLSQLENTYLEQQVSTDYYVDYYELEEKRFNNELFTAFKEKGYTTIGIGEYSAYTSFDTDYYYDFFNSYQDDYMNLDNSDLRLITNDIDNFSRKLYIRFSNSKKILKKTILADLLVDLIPLKYQEIAYNEIDINDYKYIKDAYQKNNYWTPKAIIKGLNESMKINNNRLTFIDFNMNHDPYIFDISGNVLPQSTQWHIGSYLGNYIYSSRILTDILNYIKTNDENAIIIVQADHGLHTASNQIMSEYFNTSINENQEIRNSVISAIYIPEKYQTGDESYLDNPLNISRYLINNYVGKTYNYITE